MSLSKILKGIIYLICFMAYSLGRVVVMMATVLYLSSLGVVFGKGAIFVMSMYVMYPVINEVKIRWRER